MNLNKEVGLFKSAAASFEEDPLESVLKEITASHGKKKNGRRLTAKPHEIQESQKKLLLRVSIPDAAGVSSSATTNCTSTQSASQHDGQAHPFTTAPRHADVYYGQEGAEEDDNDGDRDGDGDGEVEDDEDGEDPLAALIDEVESSLCSSSNG